MTSEYFKTTSNTLSEQYDSGFELCWYIKKKIHPISNKKCQIAYR